MSHIRYLRDSYVVRDDTGRRGRVDSATPIETIVHLDGTTGEVHGLTLLTKDGGQMQRISDFEFKDLQGVVWEKV